MSDAIVSSELINQQLSFIKGTLVLFSVFSPENPFWIKSVQEAGASSDVSGITNNGISDGTLYWNTKDVEPGTYYYVSENDAQISAEIEIKPNEGLSSFSTEDGNTPPLFMYMVREANDDGDSNNPIDRYILTRIGGRTASQVRTLMAEYRNRNLALNYENVDDNVIDDIIAHYLQFVDAIVDADLQASVESALERSGFSNLESLNINPQNILEAFASESIITVDDDNNSEKVGLFGTVMDALIKRNIAPSRQMIYKIYDKLNNIKIKSPTTLQVEEVIEDFEINASNKNSFFKASSEVPITATINTDSIINGNGNGNVETQLFEIRIFEEFDDDDLDEGEEPEFMFFAINNEFQGLGNNDGSSQLTEEIIDGTEFEVGGVTYTIAGSLDVGPLFFDENPGYIFLLWLQDETGKPEDSLGAPEPDENLIMNGPQENGIPVFIFETQEADQIEFRLFEEFDDDDLDEGEEPEFMFFAINTAFQGLENNSEPFDISEEDIDGTEIEVGGVTYTIAGSLDVGPLFFEEPSGYIFLLWLQDETGKPEDSLGAPEPDGNLIMNGPQENGIPFFVERSNGESTSENNTLPGTYEYRLYLPNRSSFSGFPPVKMIYTGLGQGGDGPLSVNDIIGTSFTANNREYTITNAVDARAVFNTENFDGIGVGNRMIFFVFLDTEINNFKQMGELFRQPMDFLSEEEGSEDIRILGVRDTGFPIFIDYEPVKEIQVGDTWYIEQTGIEEVLVEPADENTTLTFPSGSGPKTQLNSIMKIICTSENEFKITGGTQ